MKDAASLVRLLATVAGSSDRAIDSARGIALNTLKYAAAAPNPEIAAAAAWLNVIKEIDIEIPGFKALLVEALSKEAIA